MEHRQITFLHFSFVLAQLDSTFVNKGRNELVQHSAVISIGLLSTCILDLGMITCNISLVSLQN